MANPYSKPLTASYKYKPLDISSLAQPLANAQAQYDTTIKDIDKALFELDSLSPDDTRGQEIKNALAKGTDDIAKNLLSSKDFRGAGRNLAKLNKFYNSNEEIKAISTNYANWSEAVKRERKKIGKKGYTQKMFDEWQTRKQLEFADKGGTSFKDGDYNTINTGGREANMSKEMEDYALKIMKAKPSERETLIGALNPTKRIGDKDIYSRLTTKHKYIDEQDLKNDVYSLVSSSDRFKPWLGEQAEYKHFFQSRNNPKFAAEQYGDLLADKDAELANIEKTKKEIIEKREAAYKKANKTYNYETSQDKIKIDEAIAKAEKEKRGIEEGYAESSDDYIKEAYIQNEVSGRYENLAGGMGSLGSFDDFDASIKDTTIDAGNAVSKRDEKILDGFTRINTTTSENAVTPMDVLEMSSTDLNRANKAHLGNEFTVGVAGALSDFSDNLEVAQGELNVLEKNIKENYTDKNLDVPPALMAQLVDLQDDYNNQVAKYDFTTDNLETVISETTKKLTSISGGKISNELSTINTTVNAQKLATIKELETEGELIQDINGNYNAASLQKIEDINRIYKNKKLQQQIKTLDRLSKYGAEKDEERLNADKVLQRLNDFTISSGIEDKEKKGRGHYSRQYKLKNKSENDITWTHIGNDAVPLDGKETTLEEQAQAVEDFLEFDILATQKYSFGDPGIYRQHQGSETGGTPGDNWTAELMTKEKAEQYIADLNEEGMTAEQKKAKIQEIKTEVLKTINKDYKDASEQHNDYVAFENAAAATFNKLELQDQFQLLPSLLISDSYLKHSPSIAKLDGMLRRSSNDLKVVQYNDNKGTHTTVENPPNFSIRDEGLYTFKSLSRTTSDAQGGNTVAKYDANVTKLSDSELYNLFMFNEGKITEGTGEDAKYDYPGLKEQPVLYTKLLEISKNSSNTFTTAESNGTPIKINIFEETPLANNKVKTTQNLSKQFRSFLEEQLTDNEGRGASVEVVLTGTNLASSQEAMANEETTFEAAYKVGNKAIAQGALVNLANVTSVLEMPASEELYDDVIASMKDDLPIREGRELPSKYDIRFKSVIDAAGEKVGITQNDRYIDTIRELITGRREQFSEEEWDPTTNTIKGIKYTVVQDGNSKGQVQYVDYTKDPETGEIVTRNKERILNAAAANGGMTASASMIYNNLFYLRGYGDLLNEMN